MRGPLLHVKETFAPSGAYFSLKVDPILNNVLNIRALGVTSYTRHSTDVRAECPPPPPLLSAARYMIRPLFLTKKYMADPIFLDWNMKCPTFKE